MPLPPRRKVAVPMNDPFGGGYSPLLRKLAEQQQAGGGGGVAGVGGGPLPAAGPAQGTDIQRLLQFLRSQTGGVNAQPRPQPMSPRQFGPGSEAVHPGGINPLRPGPQMNPAPNYQSAHEQAPGPLRNGFLRRGRF